jgi:hypothetical protein
MKEIAIIIIIATRANGASIIIRLPMCIMMPVAKVIFIITGEAG